MREPLSRSICLRLLSTLGIILIAVLSYGQRVVKVTDQDGQALIGVESFNKDFSFATVSDVNGIVEIPKSFENDLITFKYLGFESSSLQLSNIDLKTIEVKLIPSTEILEEVLLVGRSDIRSRDFLQKIDAVRSADIAATNPQTSVDALARNADVYVQKSQMGGGSPVIRGFEANKVLLVIDGVRLNNAIYRNGHLQNAITIDNAILDQMEVIYGPSSLMYGSDALGGVIHFRTKDPVLNLSETNKVNVFGNYSARFGSANQEKTFHADVNLGFQKWGSLTSISYSDFGDLRMGSWRTENYPNYGKRFTFQSRIDGEDKVVDNENVNLQVGTAYSQIDFLQKLKYQINDQMSITANLQYSTSSNVPRYDQLILEEGEEFEFAEWYYGPQKRLMASVKYKWTEERTWMDELIVIASRQNIEESRIDRRFGSEIKSYGVESVGVNALTLDIRKVFKGARKHSIYYGADANLNTVASEAWQENIIAGTRTDDVFTRYPSGGSTMNILGAYAQYVNESRDSTIVLHAGLRYSAYSTNVKYLASDPISWPSYFYDGVDAQNNSLSWSAGINWQPNRNWTIRLLTATAFRAPNVDDIGKLRVNNDNVVVPNTALDAENSINGEININRSLGKRSLISGSFFYTQLNDAIIRMNFMLPDGRTTFSDGNRTYNVEANVNAEKAQIYGASLNLKLSILKNLAFSGAVSYIRGEVLDEEILPLSHIPPLYGRSQLKYSWQSWKFTLLSQFNGKKPLDQYGGSIDNPEYATPEGALAWAVMNFYTEYSYKEYTFQVGVENIFDKHYTPFASGVSAPGVNLILAVRGRF